MGEEVSVWNEETYYDVCAFILMYCVY